MLVASSTIGPLDRSVRRRIIAEANGNPLALLELPRTQTSAALAGGYSVAARLPLPSRIEASYRGRIRLLPVDTQHVLLLASADPVGDPVLFWRAASLLGIPVEAAAAAEAADLLEIDGRVGFRHPLLRSAIYRAATPAERRTAHRALAAATDPEIDPDRRAWHRAQAVLGPDEDVAAELERRAGRAQDRGGFAAAAAFLQRAVVLTQEPARRADRAMAAAQASLQAGEFDAALRLVGTAEAWPLDDLGRARVNRLRAEVAFALDRGGEAPLLLRQAARSLETHDARPRATPISMPGLPHSSPAAWLTREEASRMFLTPWRVRPRLQVHGCRGNCSSKAWRGCSHEGRPAAVPALRRAVAAFADPAVPQEDVLRWGWLASRAALFIWDYDRALAISTAAVRLARDAGALEALAVVDNACGQTAAAGGDFATASMLAAEVDTLKEATRTRIAPHAALALNGLRGQEERTTELVDAVMTHATVHGQGTAVQYGNWAIAVLFNGLGRYDEALPGGGEGDGAGTQAAHRVVGMARAHRGRRTDRATRAGPRRAGSARRTHRGLRLRVGARATR